MKFGCICVFKHNYHNKNRITQYEERVLLTYANSYKEAKEKFLLEFKEYESDESIFLNEYEIFKITEPNKSVIEVASSMKVFDGTDSQYLNRYFYDQKPLSCKDKGWQHCWYNIDNKKVGCYNCQEIRNNKDIFLQKVKGFK